MNKGNQGSPSIITQEGVIDILRRLEELAAGKHDDLSVAEEASDLIVSLVVQIAEGEKTHHES